MVRVQSFVRHPPRLLFPLLLAAFVLGVPGLADNGLEIPTLGSGPALIREMEIIAIFSAVVIGLNLSYGFAGELALGQAAMFAAGAYVTGMLAIGSIYPHHLNELAITIPASALAAALIGFLSGVPGLRLAGWALAYTSFFLILIIPDMASAFPTQTGSFTGLSPIPDPVLFGQKLDQNGIYWAMTGSVILIFAVFRNMVVSRHGVALQVLRQSPVLASSLGMSVYRIKLMAYVVGAIPAGIAGGFFCYINNFVSPGLFDIYTSIGFIAASVLGGSRTIYGAIVGVVIIEELGPLHTNVFTHFALPLYGVLLLIGGVFLTGGLGGSVGTFLSFFRRRVLHRIPSKMEPREPSLNLGSFNGAQLTISGVNKRFGGVHAVNDVSLKAEPGLVTGIIGPNGSGKTSLLNIVSGFYKLDSGTVTLGDRDITLLQPVTVALAGVARTFQTPAIPEGLSCLQVVGAARYAHDRAGLLPAIFRLPKYRRALKADIEEATRLLEATGLGHLVNREAASLPLGTRRLLEVARALTARPALLLLDEPASGLDVQDVRRLGTLIRATAKAGATVIVIEHNFQMMLEIADVINVLHAGRLIASGTAEEIRVNPAVLESYLGEVVDTADEDAPEPAGAPA
ncbi:MAG: branched-chain amino acid transport system ATP-binding protein livM [Chloroflexota bacterium]|jgi:branched-chain amino acid transport system permease protein|nr:branched-chain amino acid transport system ATP-binding protein livM [Chloroflexota bacterium]